MRTIALLLLVLAPSLRAQVPVPNVAPKTNTVIQLAWDASPTAGVTYRLRRGVASGHYDEMVDLAAGTLAYTWTNAPARLTNYFVVSAVSAAGEESDPSNEVGAQPKVRPEPPKLRTAVPIMVEVYRREPGKLWAKVVTVGPFYDEADHPSEDFSSVVRIGKPIQLLPE